MFDNVGNKIKDVAELFCWLGILCSILLGLGLILSLNVSIIGIFIGIVVIIVGSFMSWVGSLITYGIGEMVQNSCIQTEIAVKRSMKEEQAE